MLQLIIGFQALVGNRYIHKNVQADICTVSYISLFFFVYALFLCNGCVYE